MSEFAREVPEFATHYYVASRRPFLNLSDVEPARLSVVMAELDALARAGGSERRFGSRYMSPAAR